MKLGGRYQVGARRGYRGHEPGAIFEAVLDPRAEARAIARGDITRLQPIHHTVQPGSYTLPRGWISTQEVQ